MKYFYFTILILFFVLSGCYTPDNNQNTKILKQNIPPITPDDSTKVDTVKINKMPLEYSQNYLLGKFDPAQHPNFVKVDSTHSVLGIPLFILEEAYEAYLDMYQAALEDGIRLAIVSSARSFYEQKYIWDIKWKNSEDTLDVDKARFILRYSAMPGTSRHHWGTDIDLNSVEPAFFEASEGKLVYNWLLQNATKFGYFQPYTVINEARPTGYQEEKWHWSYAPVADSCLKLYQNQIQFQDLNGFKGSHLAKELNIIEDYVLGIAKK